MTGYIYKITRNSDGMVYVGQTIRKKVEYRWSQHCNKPTNSKIHDSLRSYGREAHTFEVIEKLDVDCSKEDFANILVELENHYIHMFNSIEHGFNKTKASKSIRYKH